MTESCTGTHGMPDFATFPVPTFPATSRNGQVRRTAHPGGCMKFLREMADLLVCLLVRAGRRGAHSCSVRSLQGFLTRRGRAVWRGHPCPRNGPFLRNGPDSWKARTKRSFVGTRAGMPAPPRSASELMFSRKNFMHPTAPVPSVRFVFHHRFDLRVTVLHGGHSFHGTTHPQRGQ